MKPISKIFYLFLFLNLLFISAPALADTIVLKDGRRIEADQVWIDGEMIRYRKFGTVIGLSEGQVTQVIEDNPLLPDNVVDFGFDHWKMGMPISVVMAVAERNGVPLHREGLISINKTYNAQMCIPYLDTHTRFDYRQQLLGYPAKVTLVFTPQSRRLSFIKVHLAPNLTTPGISPNDTVMDVMTEKYGQPRKLSKNILQKNACQWRLSGANTIELTSLSNWTELVYENAFWKSVLEGEQDQQKEIKREANHKKDSGKF
ncbi:MAG: hypothetical protein ACOWWM_09820 [Desulfobacterales bacterium]